MKNRRSEYTTLHYQMRLLYFWRLLNRSWVNNHGCWYILNPSESDRTLEFWIGTRNLDRKAEKSSVTFVDGSNFVDDFGELEVSFRSASHRCGGFTWVRGTVATNAFNVPCHKNRPYICQYECACPEVAIPNSKQLGTHFGEPKNALKVRWITTGWQANSFTLC